MNPSKENVLIGILRGDRYPIEKEAFDCGFSIICLCGKPIYSWDEFIKHMETTKLYYEEFQKRMFELTKETYGH